MSEEVVKTESEKITEREFASVKKQLEDLTSTHSELEQKYNDALNSIEEFKTAEETRKAEEAKKLKNSFSQKCRFQRTSFRKTPRRIQRCPY